MSLNSILTGAFVIGVAYLISTGKAKEYLDQLSGMIGAGLPAPGGGGGGGGPGPASAQSAGNCSKGPYPPTGPAIQTKKNGPKTRHYRSGMPDDTTTEWNASHSLKNYEFVAYLTITKIDHDDTASMKYGGTHMGTGWYDNGIGFQSGQGCLGNEPSHPDTNLCIVKGKSIGSIVGRKIGMAGVFFADPSGKGGKCELWADQMKGGWEKLAEGNNVGGFAPSNAKSECQLRIDAAPGITMDCAVVLPIGGPGSGGGGGGSAAPLPPGGTNTTPDTTCGQPPCDGAEGGGGSEESGFTSYNPYYVSALMARPELQTFSLGRWFPPPRRRYYR